MEAAAFQAMVDWVAPERALFPPWHQVAEQERVPAVTDVEGVEPFAEATVPQEMATVPLAWAVSPAAGRAPWHSAQERALARSVGVRCLAWAPTPREVAAELPAASTPVPPKPGATVALVLATAVPPWPARTPWQAVQPAAGFWTVPSTWVEAATVEAL